MAVSPESSTGFFRWARRALAPRQARSATAAVEHQVTATDADLVLGVLAEDGFAGGHMTLSKAAAAEAISEQIAQPLGLSILEAAWGVRQVLDSKMADLLRSVTIERGHDPREFVMFANGGQGPTHAWALSRELGIATFIVTPTATAQSALGTGTSDIRQTSERPCYVRIPPGQSVTEEALARIASELESAESAARNRVLVDSENMAIKDITLERTLALRYRGQAHHLDVQVSEDPIERGVIRPHHRPLRGAVRITLRSRLSLP